MSLHLVVDADFDRRWEAWRERGRVHDRLVRSRLRMALPVIALLVAVGAYVLMTR